MLKSIVVALDGSNSSANAQDLAIEVGKRTGAELIGLGVLDVPWITAPRATPIGGGTFQAHRNEALLEQGRDTIRDRITSFHEKCGAAKVDCSAIGAEGDPVEQIDQEADRHDMIIIGRQTNFHGGEDHEIGETVEKLLKDTPRPLMIAPEDMASGADANKVVVAFDGSVTASRAMHMFVLLGLAEGREVHVVSIDEDPGKAQGLAERSVALFRSYGIKAEANGLAHNGSNSSAILGAVAGLNAGRLVMGALGHEGFLRRALMGSTTRELIHEANVPIFVHH